MAESEIVVNVVQVAESMPADTNSNSGSASLTTENVSYSTLPVVRIEELKDDLNSSFSCTSGDEDHHSHPEGSDDPDRSLDATEEEFVPPSEELKEKIIQQVEFYFSDANLLKDAFLLKHVRRNKQGYVSIKLITSFKKMKALTKDYHVVADSCKSSEQLDVNEEGKKLRRKTPLPDYDETTPSRSVVIINLPMENPTIENIAEIFSKCGEVALIRILRPGKSVPQDVKKHSTKHPEIGTSICAVVEFETFESAKKAVESMNNSNDWRQGMRVVALSAQKKRSAKETNENLTPKKVDADIDDGNDDKKKKRTRGGRKHKNKQFHNDDSSCYSSGSEYDPPTRLHDKSLSPNHIDGSKLSPTSSPRSSPRSSPMTSPRSQRRRMGPHGTSPLVDNISPGTSPRPSPRNSPELGRKRYDYSSGGDSTPSSPWVQRRLKAAQESPLAGSPTGSPLIGRRNVDGSPRLAAMDGIVRFPKGPDGSKGFHFGRGKPRASTFS